MSVDSNDDTDTKERCYEALTTHTNGQQLGKKFVLMSDFKEGGLGSPSILKETG